MKRDTSDILTAKRPRLVDKKFSTLVFRAPLRKTLEVVEN